MASYNKVLLMGNLTRDPELRHLPSNTAVVGLGLAVNERWRNKQTDQWEERVNFIDCEAFGRTAEIIQQYFQKGRPIFIEGKLRLDQWQDKEGNNRSKLKVVIDSFEFVGGRGEGEGGGGAGGGGGGGNYQSGRSSAPARSGGNSGGGYNSPAGNDVHEPIDHNDIPF